MQITANNAMATNDQLITDEQSAELDTRVLRMTTGADQHESKELLISAAI